LINSFLVIFYSYFSKSGALTHTAACVGFTGWALAAVGVDALFCVRIPF